MANNVNLYRWHLLHLVHVDILHSFRKRINDWACILAPTGTVNVWNSLTGRFVDADNTALITKMPAKRYRQISDTRLLRREKIRLKHSDPVKAEKEIYDDKLEFYNVHEVGNRTDSRWVTG